MAIQHERHYTQDLLKPIEPHFDDLAFTTDNEGLVIHVDLYNGTESVAVGGSVAGAVICPDGSTVALVGTSSGNTVTIAINSDCVAIPGQITVNIQIVTGTIKTTVFTGKYNVLPFETNNPVDPSSRTALAIGDLVDDISTAIASIPADYSDLLAAVAPTFSNSSAYNIGQYVWYEGDLYRFKTAHSAGSWNSTEVAAAVVGNDLSDVKSAIQHNYTSSHFVWTLKRSIDSSGAISTANGFALSGYIPVVGSLTVKNTTNDIGVNNKTTAFHVNQFTSANVFISRTILSAGTSLTVGKTTGYIRIAYGYPTSQSVTITDELLETYFSVGFFEDCATKYDTIEKAAHDFDELGKGLYEEQYAKSGITTSWTSGMINQNTGALSDSDKHIYSNFIPVYNSLPIEIKAPDTMECIVVKYASNTSVSSYVGYNWDYVRGSQRQPVDTAYIRICVRFADGSDISTSDASNIVLSRYANRETDDVAFAINEINSILDKQTRSTTWEQGNISVTIDPETGQGTASLVSSTKHIRSGYISLKAGSSFRIDYPENKVSITVYEYDTQSAVGYTETLVSDNATGYYVYHEDNYASIRIVAKYVDDSTISADEGANISITFYTDKKDFNILVLGNSFSQDSFAYLPPVLNEALPEYVINYGVAYTSSASIQDHITLYNNSTKYTSYWEWNYKSGSWKLWTSSGDYDRGKTLTDIMALRNWDIIYVQPASRVADDSEHTAAWFVQNRIIYPGRKLLSILKSLANKPFSYLMGEWLGTDENGDHGAEVFGLIADALELTENSLGIDGVIPIGAAFQNARSNTVLQTLGDATIHNMLCADGQHMQSGIPALLATYTIANYILRLMGMKRSIQGSSFVPTDENCIAIKAWKANDAYPKMTHGSSVGVSSGVVVANMNAAQEIAIMAVRNPYTIINCANVFVDTYTPEA